jgi:hypothetical protein
VRINKYLNIEMENNDEDDDILGYYNMGKSLIWIIECVNVCAYVINN